ncbi:MAG: radical SAM protein [Thermoprotei archaeon]|nr:MAG: radical SAM protein [Thermoprotei archaeon]
MSSSLVFGPVKSRRLGSSLGVNNIPYKFCTYSCVYCQLGATRSLTTQRRSFYKPEEIVRQVEEFLRKAQVKVDYVSFVPDGEPTLDVNLKIEIEMLKERVGKPIAVLTNSSLLWIEDVRSSLYEADFVSIKVDSVSEDVWRRVNRPHSSLKLERILEGILEFSRSYRGKLVTETMLVQGLNDSEESLRYTAGFIAQVKPSVAYISIPVRPPAEKWIKSPSDSSLVAAYSIFKETVDAQVELLASIEPPPEVRGDAVKYLVSTVSVHPLKLEYAVKILEDSGLNPSDVLDELVKSEVISKVEYGGSTFIIKRFK